MNFLKGFLLLIIFANFSQGYVHKLARFNSNGIIYERPDPRSNSLLYSKTAYTHDGFNSWKNISALIESHGMKNKSMFCSYGHGGWIIYPVENYRVGKAMDLRIMAGESCVWGSKVRSVQTIGPINHILGSSTSSGLITFEGIYYTSDYSLILHDINEVSGYIKSLIHSGPLNWTIEGFTLTPTGLMKSVGQKLCLLGRPFREKEPTFCGITDIDLLLGVTERSDKIVIKRGCNQNETRMAKQTCYSEGTSRIIIESEMPPPRSLCKKHLNLLQKRHILEYSKILQLWQIRMNNSHQNLDIPEDKNKKTHLHDRFPNIVENSIIPSFEFVLSQHCPKLDQSYGKILTRVLRIIVQDIFNSKENHDMEDQFVKTVSDFGKTLMECQNSTLDLNITLQNEKSEQILNCTMVQNNYRMPFVEYFPNLIQLVFKRCLKEAIVHSNHFYEEMKQFLSHSSLDWNNIYEIGLNGMNFRAQEEMIQNCFKDNNVHKETAAVTNTSQSIQ